MGWLEIVILCAVALWLIATLVWLIRCRGKGCSGCCADCGRCDYRENCIESNKRE